MAVKSKKLSVAIERKTSKDGIEWRKKSLECPNAKHEQQVEARAQYDKPPKSKSTGELKERSRKENPRHPSLIMTIVQECVHIAICPDKPLFLPLPCVVHRVHFCLLATKYRSSSSRDKLLRCAVDLGQELVRRTLDDPAGDRQLTACASEEGINIASAHAAFIDTPDEQLAYILFVSRSEESERTRQSKIGHGDNHQQQRRREDLCCNVQEVS
jgi:hypothetical protein